MPIVSQLSKCLKFMAFRGVILYWVQSFLSPWMDLNFRHLSSCDTIVNSYTRTNLIWKSSVRVFASEILQFTMLPPFQQRRFPSLYLRCFRNIQPVKTTLAPEDEYCFLLLLLQAIVIIMGIALINAKAKYVFAKSLQSYCLMGHRGRQLIDDLTCFVLQLPKLWWFTISFVSDTMRQASSVCSSLKVFSRRCDLWIKITAITCLSILLATSNYRVRGTCVPARAFHARIAR